MDCNESHDVSRFMIKNFWHLIYQMCQNIKIKSEKKAIDYLVCSSSVNHWIHTIFEPLWTKQESHQHHGRTECSFCGTSCCWWIQWVTEGCEKAMFSLQTPSIYCQCCSWWVRPKTRIAVIAHISQNKMTMASSYWITYSIWFNTTIKKVLNCGDLKVPTE